MVSYDQMATLARVHRPKRIVAGFSAYSRIVDWARFRAIADEVGALLFADMAHVAGLVAAGLYPNPVPFADVVTTTTHKTLRGPRGGLILARQNESIAKRINSTIFPGTQGGPLMHVIGRESSGFHGSTATAIPGLSATSAAKCPCHVRDAGVPGTEDHLGRHRQSSLPARSI